MKLPQQGDYIDIHTHKVRPVTGVFAVENLMAHENIDPVGISAAAFTAGIHPWYLNEDNRKQLLEYVRKVSVNPDLIAFGEAGFDKLRGPAMEIQRTTFEEQVHLACEIEKPLFIHCVRAWDELMSVHKNLRPSTTWMVHGFRGKKELVSQLLTRGMYISLWFDFVLRPESAELLRFIPKNRIFLETDGADVEIKDIYGKVAADLEISEDELKSIIFSNYKELFLKY
jgi:TatD DNase family protein